MKEKGFALISLIILMVVIGLLVYPTTAFIGQSLRLNALRAQKFQAYAAGHAGLMRAAYEALADSNYASAEAQLSGNQWYKYAFDTSSFGGNAGAANIHTDASASTQPVNTQITGWTIINNSSEAATIVSMRLSWIATANNLLAVQLNGVSVWSGTAVTGTTIDITDTSIPAGTTVTSNKLTFDGNMSNVSVYITFNFANGTAITRRIWRAQNAILPDWGPWYPTGLQSWWKMYEGSGSTVNDIINPNSANPPNDGEISEGATWTASGKFGSALAFDASSSAFVDCGTVSSLTGASFSVSAWIYLNSLPGANASYGIINRGNNSSSAPYDLTRGYELYVNRNNDAVVANRNKIIWAIGPKGTSNKAVSTSVPSTSTWIHVAGTYDGANARLYVDSVLNATAASSYSANGRFYMGTRKERTNTYMKGRIDEAAYFNKSLTSTEVLAIFTPNTQTAVVPTSVKSTGKFIDNSSTVQMRQTMIATFDVTGGEMDVTNYSETVEHLLP